MHDIAGIHLPHAGAPVERRGDGGVAKQRARVVDLRLVLVHQRLELRHLRPRRVGLLAGGIVVRRQLGVARQIQPRVGKLRLVLRLLGRRLVERRLVGARIDLRQHVALLHVLAFGEVHHVQRAIDHRLDGHHVERLHRAERIQIDRHVLLFGGRDQHRDRLVGVAVAGRLIAGTGRPEPDRVADTRDDQHAQHHHQPAAGSRAGHQIGRFAGQGVHIEPRCVTGRCLPPAGRDRRAPAQAAGRGTDPGSVRSVQSSRRPAPCRD